MRILHLTDTHLAAGGALHHGIVDTLESLDRVLASVTPDTVIDLVVASGDLSDDGSVESYEVLRDRIEPWARDRGAAVVYAMGNHDTRASFASVLGGNPESPLDSSTVIAGTRVLVLDSTVPGAGYGLLRPEQLDWVRNELRTPAPSGSLVVLHHPPVPAATELLQALALQNPSDLMAAVVGSDVRAILAGHYHHALATAVSGIPVLVAPAVANRADVLAEAGTERAVFGAGAAVVDLGTDGSVRTVALAVGSPRDGEELFVLDAAAVRRIAIEAGPPGTDQRSASLSARAASPG
ncbi:metallophosphoesterase [Planctomonas psychrotolerans]|uniref:metallophosphoesterase n=1 Tax=Planctomonas psychrotolerans TaxID=2528712 RepID=UPI00123A5C1D|nr:metallophosphoesterase [Planctomonas psychrotolerans]